MNIIDYGSSISGNLATAEEREWLVTNGIGSYASGTIANILTRRYHGLLVAALNPPAGHTVLAAKLDESVRYDERAYRLFTNRWDYGVLDPHGYRHIERFHMEGTTPVWTFAMADALLEKRVWMKRGENTTYVLYRLVRASAPLEFNAKSLVNFRDFHGESRGGSTRIDLKRVEKGFQVQCPDREQPFFVLSRNARIEFINEWYRGFSLSLEQQRGFTGLDDHLHAGEFSSVLSLGDSFTIVLSTNPEAALDGEAAYAERKAYEADVIKRAPGVPPLLALAADQFIVDRPTQEEPDAHSIVAGYHWSGDFGRDTMISLPGLTLCTGRPEIARSILHTFSRYVSEGMLPNRFPVGDDAPQYHTADATLWYFEAIRAYYSVTRDKSLLKELYPVLADIIDWHVKGTRHHIHVDPADGLLYAGQDGMQLTWMDARIGDWVVTPRTGKAVEINALWYNALCSMVEFSVALKKSGAKYEDLADRACAGFSRFWNEKDGYCYDVLDTPHSGNDASLRPNQLFAVALKHSPLSPERQKAVVDICARRLLTPHGLRSLAVGEPGYVGTYSGDIPRRDGAYHQGTVWGWLIGPFISANLRVYHDPKLAASFLEPFTRHLTEFGLGSVSEIFDGDPPFTPRGRIAQAWSVAELIRANCEINQAAKSS